MGSPGGSLVWVSWGWAQQHTTTNNNTTQQHHNNNNTRKCRQNTKTLKLAKVGLAKVGQDNDWLKSVKKLAIVGLAKVGLAKVGHDPSKCPRLLPVQGTLGVHDALACKCDDTLRLSFLCVEAEPMPCRTACTVTMMVRMLWTMSFGSRAISGTTQVYLNFLTLKVPAWSRGISVQILHANRKSFLDQALTQFLEHVENLSKWVARADPRNELV